MLGAIFSFYLVATILMCFVQMRIGIAMFLLYSLLVPFLKLFSFGENLFPFLIMAALLFNYGYKKLVYKPLLPFLFLYLAQLLLIPFHYDVPIDVQLNSFRADLMSTLLLPLTMINVISKDAKALPLFKKTLVIVIIIASLYSLLLTSTPGINPYLLVVMPLSGHEFNNTYALAENEGRVFGRISGVFTHPMTNGLFLSFSLIYLLALFGDKRNNFKKRILFLPVFLAVALAIFFIGVRTAIGASIIALCTYILLEKRAVLILYIIAGGLLLSIVLQQVKGMQDVITSMFDSKSSTVSGSSLDMRISQFNGALHEIKNNLLFGKGYGWTAYYWNLKGDHPVLLAFESIVYIVLCNNGIIGIAVWLVMLYLYYYNIAQEVFRKRDFNILMCLMITYVAYSIITGEYGYMKYLLIFYTIMWSQGLTLHSRLRQISRYKYEQKSKSNRILSSPISSNT